jgi:hypothetical protein
MLQNEPSIAETSDDTAKDAVQVVKVWQTPEITRLQINVDTESCAGSNCPV